MRMLAITSGVVAISLTGEAMGQTTAKVQIDAGASYEQSLKCYQYYGVAQQVAEARAAKAKVGSDDQKAFQARGAVNRVLKAVWNAHIDATKANKSGETVDADLGKIGEPIIADANAGLAGDKAAAGRYEEIQVQCKTFEKVDKPAG